MATNTGGQPKLAKYKLALQKDKTACYIIISPSPQNGSYIALKDSLSAPERKVHRVKFGDQSLHDKRIGQYSTYNPDCWVLNIRVQGGQWTETTGVGKQLENLLLATRGTRIGNQHKRGTEWYQVEGNVAGFVQLCGATAGVSGYGGVGLHFKDPQEAANYFGTFFGPAQSAPPPLPLQPSTQTMTNDNMMTDELDSDYSDTHEVFLRDVTLPLYNNSNNWETFGLNDFFLRKT